jgi:PKD domain-containing protein
MALAPPASAGWLAPLPLSAPDSPGSQPALALGSDGRLVAAWTRSDGTRLRIEAAERQPGGALEQPQIVSEAGIDAAGAQVAVDAAGNALLVWVSANTYKWATRPAGAAAFGNVNVVSLPAGERASTYRLVMAPDGLAAAVILTFADETMTSTRSRVRVMTRAPGGDFVLSPALDQGVDSSTTDFSVGAVDMDVDAQGGLYATWTRSESISSSSATNAVRIAVRPPGGSSFSQGTVFTGVTNSSDAVEDTQVAEAHGRVDAAGNLTVIFTLTRTDVSPAQSQVLLRSRPPGGPLDPGVTPITPPAQPDGPKNVALDVNPAGTGLLAWSSGSGGGGVMEACVRPPGGPCGATQPLASGSVFDPAVAIGAGGAMVAVWRRGLGAADASFAPAGMPLGAAHELGTGIQVLAPEEAVAVDALGHAAVGVDRFTASNRVTEAVINDSVAPSFGSFAVPAAGQPGESLAFGAGLSDVWGAVTSSWDFGDGGSAAGPGATHAYADEGAFTAALTATDSFGNSATRSGTVAVADTRAPDVLAFGMTHRTFAVGPGRTPLSSRRVPLGTAFRVKLSERATARIAIQRARPGRRAGGRCRKPSPRLSRRPRCKRWTRLGTLRRKLPVGSRRVPFSGRLGRRALHLGGHRAVLVATDAAGNRSRPARAGFRVVRR